MNRYESLLAESPITVDDHADLPPDYLGLYVETNKSKVILINKNVKKYSQKNCILAEELGHYYTSYGNIIDLSDTRSRKQELKAHKWAYEKLIPLQRLVEASREGVRNRYELAEYLDVTEEFLECALTYYKNKYGLYVKWTSYLIYFEPLGVFESF